MPYTQVCSEYRKAKVWCKKAVLCPPLLRIYHRHKAIKGHLEKQCSSGKLLQFVAAALMQKPVKTAQSI